MVEQNARAALEASDRGYVLSDGAARLEGPARELLGDPAIARDLPGGGAVRGR